MNDATAFASGSMIESLSPTKSHRPRLIWAGRAAGPARQQLEAAPLTLAS